MAIRPKFPQPEKFALPEAQKTELPASLRTYFASARDGNATDFCFLFPNPNLILVFAYGKKQKLKAKTLSKQDRDMRYVVLGLDAMYWMFWGKKRVSSQPRPLQTVTICMWQSLGLAGPAVRAGACQDTVFWAPQRAAALLNMQCRFVGLPTRAAARYC